MRRTILKLLSATALCASIPLHAAVFTSDFSSGNPPGSSVSGSAFVDGGALKLTVGANSLSGTFFLQDFAGGAAITNFKANFKLALGGGTCCGSRMADGMSFVMASDLAPGTSYAEEGFGNGISVTFDTWDNAAPDTAPAIDVRTAGTVAAFQSMGTLGGAIREGGRAPDGPVLTNALGQEVQIFTFGPAPAPQVFVPVTMELFPDNTFSMSFSNVTIWNRIPVPGYVPVAGANWGFGARTGGANEDAWIDDLQIFANFTAGPAAITAQPQPQTVTESQTATFIVQVDGTPVYSFQWLTNGVAIPGANGQSYTTPPTTVGMNGLTYTVAVSNELSGGVAVISSGALLTVNSGVFAQTANSEGRTNGIRVRFSKNVALSGNYTLNNGATVTSVAYGATHQDVMLTTSMLTPEADYQLTISGEVGEDASALVPDPSILNFHQGFGAFCTDFASALPPGGVVFNNLVAGAGQIGDDGSGTNPVLHLTDDGINGAYGKLYISNRTGNTVLRDMQASWRMRIGGNLNGHADGFSFNWANNIAANGNFVAAEGGEGTGLTFIIDTWDGGSGPGTGMEIKYQGTRLAFVHIPRTDEGDGNFLCRDEFVNVSASINSLGQASFTYHTNTLVATVPTWAGITGGAMALEARTGGEDDNFWIDDVCINNFTLGPVAFIQEPVETEALEGQTATFVCRVDGSPSYGFQWFTNGVPVPGANRSTYTTPAATAAMEGQLVSVLASNAFSSVTSSNAVLHVKLSPRVVSVTSRGTRNVHIVYTRPVDLNSGTYDFDNGAFEGTRAYGASHSEVVITADNDLLLNTTYSLAITDVADENDGSNLLFPNPTTKTFRHGFGSYRNDFAVDQAASTSVDGVSLYGTAYVSGGVLHLTDNVDSQNGSAIFEDRNGGFPLDRFQIRYRAYVGGGGGNPADGYSLNIGGFANAAIGGGEEGQGVGLVVAFDNFDNGGGEAPAIDIKWNNTVLAHTMTSVMRSDLDGAPPVSPNFLDTYVNLDPDGTLDVIVNGVQVYNNLATPFAGMTGARVGFGGRTGGLVEANWIDDLSINAFSLGDLVITHQPADVSVPEAPASAVSFRVDVDGVPPYTVQWYSNSVPIVGGNGLVYQTPPLGLAASGSAFQAIVNNSFGSVTSRVATVTVTRQPTVLSLVRNADGSATFSWPAAGFRLQATARLEANPAATVWQDLPFPSGTVIPPGYFGTGSTNVFFRLITP